MKLYRVTLYFRNIIDSCVSVWLRACWKNFGKIGGSHQCLCIQHASPLQSDWVTSQSDSNHKAAAWATGLANYLELKAKRQWAFGSEVYMLSGGKVRLGKVYSLHIEVSHFGTFGLVAAVPIYISICFESVTNCSCCALLLCFMHFHFIPNWQV